MNENTKSNRFSQYTNINARAVKSDSTKFKYRQVYGFAGKKPTSCSILPREDAFDIEKWLENFEKKMDKFFDNIIKATPKIVRGIRGYVNTYTRFLMLCALITYGYAFLISMIESNPNIIETLPNLTNLLQSMNVLAGYATDFLHWNFVWAARIIEQLIAEATVLIS